MKFAPIHNHSHFSALDGLSTHREIAERCQEIGVSAVGLTDHGTASGHLEFDKVMREHDLKPIFGVEFYHGLKTNKSEFTKNERDQAHFIAGALTDEGLRNLWRLVDRASRNFRFVGRVNWSMLKDCQEGIFATSACISGLVSQGIMKENLDPLNQYLEIFGDNFYIELHTYPSEDQELINKELVSIGIEKGIPFIYATDAHFAFPDQYETHDIYVAMQTGDNIMTPIEERKMWHPKSLYIQDEETIKENLSYLPESVVEEALENSHLLAERCNADLPPIRRHLPQFHPKESPYVDPDQKDMSAAQFLMWAVEKGIEDRYENPTEEIWERATSELEVFLEPKLEHYFLQAYEFVRFCDDHNIHRGPGRGSAGGSIISYALGITDVDPLKYDLIFERFYNPGREKGFPDIDCDFPTKDRPKVKQFMENRWGADRVRAIGTVTRLKPKEAIDRTRKVCAISFARADELKAIVDQVPDIDILGADSIGWDSDIDPGKVIYVMHPSEGYNHSVGEQIFKWVNSIQDPQERERIQDWILLIRVVCSRISGYGIHPSGVVISDVPLEDELPCMWNSHQKTQVTCFPMTDVEKRQFVKDDFLGLANLDILDEWVRQVEPLVGPINWKEIEEDHNEEMWRLLEKGLTLGIFQIEGGYGRHLCKELKPKSIEDLGVIVALNRPGPIRSGAPDKFIQLKNGEITAEYDHPILEEILEPTYGQFLYQEQVIAFFNALGYSPSDADIVRKIIGKKKPKEMSDLYEGKAEWEGKGYKEVAFPQLGNAAQIIWKKIEDFSKYSFNKAHAIEYGTLTFRNSFAKFSSPAHYYVACIKVAIRQQKAKKEIGAYISEARRMGIKIAPPNIDTSQADVSTVEGTIYLGFLNIKGIASKSTAEYICHLRDTYEINSPSDLVDAIDGEQKTWEEEKTLAKKDGAKFTTKSPKQTLPQNRIPALFEAGCFDHKIDRSISLRERQELEKELLGVIITDDCEAILSKHWEQFVDCDKYSTLDFNGAVSVPGIVSSITPKKTKKDGKAMGLVTIEYEGEQAEFVVFPREWKSYKFLWNERTPAIFSLTKTDRGIRFEGATKLT